MKKIYLCLILAIFLVGCGVKDAGSNVMDFADDVLENPGDYLAEPEADFKGCNITKKPKGCKVFDTCNMLRHMNRAAMTNDRNSWECLYTTYEFGCAKSTIATGCQELIGEKGAAEEMDEQIEWMSHANINECVGWTQYYDGGRENLTVIHNLTYEEQQEEYGIAPGMSQISMSQLIPSDTYDIAAIRDWVWSWYFVYGNWEIGDIGEDLSAEWLSGYAEAGITYNDCESGKPLRP